jgi:hypothetical protein
MGKGRITAVVTSIRNIELPPGTHVIDWNSEKDVLDRFRVPVILHLLDRSHRLNHTLINYLVTSSSPSGSDIVCLPKETNIA